MGPMSQLRPPSDFRLPADVGEVLSNRLRRVHERVAQTTERRVPAAIAEIAMHYDQSGTPDKAYQYALMAADQARATYAHPEALDLLRIAERNAASESALADVRLRMAQVAECLGRYEEAEALCNEVVDWTSTHGDPRRSLAPRRIRERIRSLLGQPARKTLAACLALDEEARERGVEVERVSLLTMISQAHGRLGERAAAERMANEAVRLAERAHDSSLLADALVRLGITREPLDSDEAARLYQRALDLYRAVGDLRGQARCHNNLGIIHQLRSEWTAAQDQLDCAIALARSAGIREVWGLSALNAGVMALKRGDFDRAGDRFGEALALFGMMKNTERQLYAVYNLAHLDRERGELESAQELYDVSTSLARAIGQSDVEIGARAGFGIALLDTGKDVAARVASLEAAERLRTRDEWFQGRELAEALRVRILASDGKTLDARRRLDEALALAAEADVYGAAWLAAHCAPALLPKDASYARGIAGKYAGSARAHGYTPVSDRIDAITNV
jgi:tetratricopeptide (TPR) repeat protein